LIDSTSAQWSTDSTITPTETLTESTTQALTENTSQKPTDSTIEISSQTSTDSTTQAQIESTTESITDSTQTSADSTSESSILSTASFLTENTTQSSSDSTQAQIESSTNSPLDSTTTTSVADEILAEIANLQSQIDILSETLNSDYAKIDEKYTAFKDEIQKLINDQDTPSELVESLKLLQTILNDNSSGSSQSSNGTTQESSATTQATLVRRKRQDPVSMKIFFNQSLFIFIFPIEHVAYARVIKYM
jgi:RNA processing factor Prp31